LKKIKNSGKKYLPVVVDIAVTTHSSTEED